MRGGVLGTEFDSAARSDVRTSVREAEQAAKDEVWAAYRFVALADTHERNGLKVIDLGAGHASASDTLCGRIISALKAEALLNESVGAGYIDRHWPPAFKEAAAWPLPSLRQSFLTGALTRLIDPDAILRRQIVDFVSRGDFGLGSGAKPDGGFERLWYREPVLPEEVAFEADVFLLTKAKAEELKARRELAPQPQPDPRPGPEPPPGPQPPPIVGPGPGTGTTTLRLTGAVPPEIWNRLGTKLIPKLRAGDDLVVTVGFEVSVGSTHAQNMQTELGQILADLGLTEKVSIERS